MEKITTVNVPKNLAQINCINEIGRTMSNSIIPDLISSLNTRILMAGMRNKKTQGASPK